MSLNPSAQAFVPTFSTTAIMPEAINAPVFVPQQQNQLSQPKTKKGKGAHKKKPQAKGSPTVQRIANPRVPQTVNRSKFTYSPTGALYGATVRSLIDKANYSPTGAMYGPSALQAKRLHESLTPSIQVAILKQIDFYFGDSNFPKDKFLQKAVKKGNEGFVPIRTVADFNKIKKLTNSWRLVAIAITDSTVVELNRERTAIRRRTKVPALVVNSSWNRTVVVENMPESSRIEVIQEKFGTCGTVEHVRVLKVNQGQPDHTPFPKDIESYMEAAPRVHDVLKYSRGCVLVEYSTVDEAQSACEKLTDKNNWRSGLKVTLLWPKKVVKGPKVEEASGVEGADTAEEKAVRKSRQKDRRQRLFEEHPELANIGDQRRRPKMQMPTLAVPVNVLRNPIMPDGKSRGFGAGRGKPISANP